MQHENASTPADGSPARHLGEIQRVTWVGLGVNVALSALKFAAGLWGSSQAILADGVHSLSDCSTDIAVLVGVRYWSVPPDEQHPYGHRRIETLVTVFIGVCLAAVALGLVYNSLATLAHPLGNRPGSIALLAGLASIVVKELLYRWTVAAGRRTRCSALVANAWHHRSDALSSIPAVLAVSGAMVVPDWVFLDHVGAVVVALFVLQAAWRIVRPAFGELIDTGAPPEDLERIESLVMDIEEVTEVHAIRTRYTGPGLQVDLHVWVPGDMTVREGHEVAHRVRRRLVEKGPDVLDVLVHVEPCEDKTRHDVADRV